MRLDTDPKTLMEWSRDAREMINNPWENPALMRAWFDNLSLLLAKIAADKEARDSARAPGVPATHALEDFIAAADWLRKFAWDPHTSSRPTTRIDVYDKARATLQSQVTEPPASPSTETGTPVPRWPRCPAEVSPGLRCVLDAGHVMGHHKREDGQTWITVDNPAPPLSAPERAAAEAMRDFLANWWATGRVVASLDEVHALYDAWDRASREPAAFKPGDYTTESAHEPAAPAQGGTIRGRVKALWTERGGNIRSATSESMAASTMSKLNALIDVLDEERAERKP